MKYSSPTAKWGIYLAKTGRVQVTFGWDDNEVSFVLDLYAELDYYSASSLKQQSAGRHVAPLGLTILLPSQAVLVLSSNCVVERQQIPIL